MHQHRQLSDSERKIINRELPEYAGENSPERELADPIEGSIRYLEHGYPNPLVRWHYHEDYEIHLIVATSGEAFVGDYIGRFDPGHLVLTGPRLPHNWISSLPEHEYAPRRDMLIQFRHETIANAAQTLPELEMLIPFMESTEYGMEFFDMGKIAEDYMCKIRDSRGIERLTQFLLFMQKLAQSKKHRRLSSSRVKSNLDRSGQDKVSAVVDYISDNLQDTITLEQVSDLIGMSESHFSRFFRKATGNTFKDFLSGMRISKACELLTTTDRQITNICYDVGYNNIANFNRRFLERKKVTPREYRRQAKARLIRGGEVW